jgi:hypothetical protein
MSRLKSKAQQSHRSKLPSTNTKDRIPWSKQVAKKDAKEKRRTQKARKRVLMASASLCEERSALKRMRHQEKASPQNPFKLALIK